MSTAGAARLLAVGATWRLTGAAPAGRALVGGLVEGDESRAGGRRDRADQGG